MRRTQIYLTNEQHAQITLLAKEQGLTFSEMLRRIIDEFLKVRGKKGLNVKALKKYSGFIKAKDLGLPKNAKIKGQDLINDYYENDVV